jgi:hypothetical protein
MVNSVYKLGRLIPHCGNRLHAQNLFIQSFDPTQTSRKGELAFDPVPARLAYLLSKRSVSCQGGYGTR